MSKKGTLLAVQWLRIHAPNAEGTSSIPSWGTKIPHVAQHSQINKEPCSKKKKN